MSARPAPPPAPPPAPSAEVEPRRWQPAGLPWAGAVATLLLALLVSAVLISSDGLVTGDAALHTWPLTHRPPTAQSIARAVTDSGTFVWPYLFVLLAGALTGATWRVRLIRGAAALAVLLVGQALRTVTMTLIARPRPPRSDWAAHASGFSMPSGHTATTAIAAGIVCWALARSLRHTVARCLCVLALTWAVCVALTRVYLGVHWMSDILAGWLFAAAYLAFVIRALAPLEQRTAPPVSP